MQIISLFPLYSLASGSVLVLDILSSGEMGADFYLFARMQWELGQGSKESGVSPALAVLHQQFTSHRDQLWMDLIFLWLQRHRGSLKVVSIFPHFPHSSKGTGCAEGSWHTATSTASLSRLKIHSALPQPALGTPEHPPAICSPHMGLFVLLFLAEHIPQESSPAWLAAVLSPAPHTVSSSSVHAGHPVCIWQGRYSAVLSPWLVVSHLTASAQPYSC